jgi:hypothetical protein
MDWWRCSEARARYELHDVLSSALHCIYLAVDGVIRSSHAPSDECGGSRRPDFLEHHPANCDCPGLV